MPDARELCDSAIELAEQGRFDEAIQVIKQDPKTRQARTAWKQANEALLAKITPLSPSSDIQTRLVKEK